MRSSRTLLFVCALGFAAPAVLAAGPETTVMTDKARKLYLEGNEALKRKKFLEAEASYLAAWALNPHWQIAANLADAELELGKNREAAEHATYYQKNAPADRQAKANALLQRALARVVKLTIAVDLAGAEILVDGAYIGHAPLPGPIFVGPGSHQITARFPERPDAAQTVSLKAGSAESISLMIPQTPLPPPLPDAGAPQPAGTDPAPEVAPAFVDAGAPPPPPGGTTKEGGPSVPVIIGGSALAVVAVVSGGVLLGVAHGKADDADQQAAQMKAIGTMCASPPTGACASLHDLNAKSDALHNAGVPLVVAGGAIGVGTLLYALWPRKRTEQPPPVRVVPATGKGSAGLWLNGSFR